MGCEAKVETVHVTSENLLMTSDDGFRTEFELAMINEDYALAEKIAKSQTNALPNDSRAWLQLAYPLMMLKQYDEGMSRWLLKLDDGLAWVKGILFRSGGKRARRNSSR